ncbi:hypothetical protein BDR06DRAFT_1015324 [Suillus hirtellus]|nr:hypothetical protein BDR06DRAFT_1015324 [Suillus hirtellus]
MASTLVRNAKKKAMDKAEKTQNNTRKQHQATKANKGSQCPESESPKSTKRRSRQLYYLFKFSSHTQCFTTTRELIPVSEKYDEAEAVKRKRRRLEKKSSEKKSLGLPVDKHSARARKPAAEAPVWPDDIISESEEQSSANHSPASLLKSNTSTFVNPSTSLSTIDHAHSRATSQFVSIIIESGTSTNNFGSRGATELLLTKDERVKLTDQNSVTLQVVQGAILEAKAHMTFTSGYPELTEKASFSRQSLLKGACDRAASSIEKKIQIDDDGTSNLVLSYNNSATNAEAEALAFLDLDWMDGD